MLFKIENKNLKDIRRTKLKKTSPRSFAYGLNFYKLFWLFFIGSFIGVLLETLWCVLTLHRLESRTGLIFGPFNPVYGFGTVFITICLYKLRNKRDLWVFVGGVLLGGAFEYACSWVQQLLFGTVSWEYSHTEFNIGGRTNLMYAFFWGILSLLWIKHLFPLLSKSIERIPNKIGIVLTWVFIVYMALNMGISGMAVTRQTERQMGRPASDMADRMLDRYFTDHFLKLIYPNMQIVMHSPKR